MSATVDKKAMRAIMDVVLLTLTSRMGNKVTIRWRQKVDDYVIKLFLPNGETATQISPLLSGALRIAEDFIQDSVNYLEVV